MDLLTQEQRHKNMSQNRNKDTKPETEMVVKGFESKILQDSQILKDKTSYYFDIIFKKKKMTFKNIKIRNTYIVKLIQAIE